MRSLKTFKISLGFVVNTIVLLILSSSIYAKPPVIQAVPPDIFTLYMEHNVLTNRQDLILTGINISDGSVLSTTVDSIIPSFYSFGFVKYSLAVVPGGKIYVAYAKARSTGFYDVVLKEYANQNTLVSTQQVAIPTGVVTVSYTGTGARITDLDIKLDQNGNPFIAVAQTHSEQGIPQTTYDLYLYYLQNGALVTSPMLVQGKIYPWWVPGSQGQGGEVKLDIPNNTNNRLYLTAAFKSLTVTPSPRQVWEFEIDTTNFTLIAQNLVSPRSDVYATSPSYSTPNNFVAITGDAIFNSAPNKAVYHNVRPLQQNTWTELSQFGIFQTFDCKLDVLGFLECGAVDLTPSGGFIKSLAVYINANPSCGSCWIRHAIPGTTGVNYEGMSLVSGITTSGVPVISVASRESLGATSILRVFHTSNLVTWTPIVIPVSTPGNSLSPVKIYLEKYF